MRCGIPQRVAKSWLARTRPGIWKDRQRESGEGPASGPQDQLPALEHEGLVRPRGVSGVYYPGTGVLLAELPAVVTRGHRGVIAGERHNAGLEEALRPGGH